MTADTDKGNVEMSTPPIPESGETHGERITEIAQEGDGTLTTERDVEVYLSSEISERAPTEKRPDPVYGTSSKVSLTYRLSHSGFEKYLLDEMIEDLHGRQERAMQAEIERRKWEKATAAGLPGSGNDPDNVDSVPF